MLPRRRSLLPPHGLLRRFVCLYCALIAPFLPRFVFAFGASVASRGRAPRVASTSREVSVLHCWVHPPLRSCSHARPSARLASPSPSSPGFPRASSSSLTSSWPLRQSSSLALTASRLSSLLFAGRRSPFSAFSAPQLSLSFALPPLLSSLCVAARLRQSRAACAPRGSADFSPFYGAHAASSRSFPLSFSSAFSLSTSASPSAREPPRSARFASRNKQICNTDNVAEDELEDASDGKGTSKRLEADEALKLETVVGLEAHVQLLTATKLFCACPSQVALTAAAAKLAPDLAARVTRFVASHLAADAADGCASARASPSPSLSSPPPGDFPSSLLSHVSSPPSVSSASASSSSSSASQPLSLWPNTFVCPVCLGEPGSLPTPSRAAVVAACKAALLLQCTDIPETLEFDRKCYIYPDLSKNYQISQIRWPIGRNGHIVLPSSGKHIRIRGVHLEEDTAKMLTATRAASASDAQRRGEGRRLSCRASLPVDALQGERDNVDEGLGSEVDGDEDAFLDMNRASLPLVEIVTEPDFRGADEAVEFLRELRLLFRSAGIATCVMSEGALRCDLNVSLRDTHTKKDFPRTEVKNVGSLRAVRKAIQFEALRQTALLESASTGGRSQTGSEFPASVERRCASSREEDADEGQSAHGLEAQTRMWDDRHQQTRKMRKKFLSEEYFPVRENLIPPVALPRALLDELRANLTETPASRLTRYVSLGVPPYSARTLIRDPEVAAYFEEAVAGGAPAPAAAAWLLNEVAGWRRRRRSEASRARTERGRSARDSSGAAGRPNAGEADPRRASEAAAEAAEADGEDRTDTPAAPRTGAALLPLTQLKLTPRKFAEMLRLVEQGVLTHNVAKQLLPTLLFSWDGSVQELLEAIEGDREAPEAPAAESTAQEVERQAREILQASPELLQRFENGMRNMADFVVGKILKQQQAAAGRDVAARSGDRPEEIKATVLELMDALSARGRT